MGGIGGAAIAGEAVSSAYRLEPGGGCGGRRNSREGGDSVVGDVQSEDPVIVGIGDVHVGAGRVHHHAMRTGQGRGKRKAVFRVSGASADYSGRDAVGSIFANAPVAVIG